MEEVGAVGEDDVAELRAGEALFEHEGAAGVAEGAVAEHGDGFGAGLVEGIADDDALACR
jgi:hypothetical protein